MVYNFTKGYKPQVQKCILWNEVFFHLGPQKLIYDKITERTLIW